MSSMSRIDNTPHDFIILYEDIDNEITKKFTNDKILIIGNMVSYNKEMGTKIYKAYTRDKSHIYCIKVMDKRKYCNIGNEFTFYDAVDTSDCDNLISCISKIDIHGNYYIIYNWYSAGDLFTLYEKNYDFTEDVFKKIATDILTALVYLNERKYVHNDIKPENILYDEKNNVYKLIDYDLATVSGSTHDTLFGTECYISPEMYYNKITLPQSDVWTVGVTIYSLIASTFPFKKFKFTPFKTTILVQKNMSSELIDFLGTIFTIDYLKRPTPIELLNHKWLTDEETKISVDSRRKRNICKSILRKFKKNS